MKVFSKIINLFILMTILVVSVSEKGYAQLKEFDIKREKPPESIPIFTNNPDEAAIIIYSSITDLYFESNMNGIVDDKSNPDEGKYILLIRPIRQILTVKANSYIEGKFRIPNMEPRDVLYYSIESQHGRGDFILKTIPSGADIHISGLPDFVAKTPFTFVDYLAQPYKIKIVKEGFVPLDTAITIEKGRVLTETFELIPIRRKEVVPTVSQNIQIKPKSKGKAVLMSVLLPGTGQLYYGTVGKGLIFTGISVGLAYSAYFYNDSFSKSWDRFNIDLENYRNAKTISEIVRTKKIKNDSYAKAIQERNITLGSAGLLGMVWLYNIWDSGRNFKNLQKGIEVSLNRHNTLQLSYKF